MTEEIKQGEVKVTLLQYPNYLSLRCVSNEVPLFTLYGPVLTDFNWQDEVCQRLQRKLLGRVPHFILAMSQCYGEEHPLFPLLHEGNKNVFKGLNAETYWRRYYLLAAVRPDRRPGSAIVYFPEGSEKKIDEAVATLAILKEFQEEALVSPTPRLSLGASGVFGAFQELSRDSRFTSEVLPRGKRLSSSDKLSILADHAIEVSQIGTTIFV